MRKVLTQEFFNRSATTVAKELLGKFLVRKIEGNPSTGLRAREIALMITETEAYDGFKDQASHAHRGKTARNAVMFGEPGTIYVYFTYGMHWMLNLVCAEAEYPAAVLVRGAGGVVGPARLTKFLQIDKTLNAKTLGKTAGLWVEDRGVKISQKNISAGPRIGVAYAGLWAKKPWRFIATDFWAGKKRESRQHKKQL